jgi:hypothetical protein
MKPKLNIYYDREGDYFEVNLGSLRNSQFLNKGDGVFEIVSRKTQKTIGFAIAGFTHHAQNKALASLLPDSVRAHA